MRFRRNPRFDAQQRREPEFRKGLADAAKPAQRHAEAFARQAGAPWMPRRGARAMIVVDVQGDEVRLVNQDHGAHLVEWGSANNQPHAPLRRGVRAAGLKLTET